MTAILTVTSRPIFLVVIWLQRLVSVHFGESKKKGKNNNRLCPDTLWNNCRAKTNFEQIKFACSKLTEIISPYLIFVMVLTLTPAGSIRKLLSVCLPTTLGARDFSCAVSSFGQAFISDPREKPLDRSAISLMAPNQSQTRLNQFSPDFGRES